MGHRFRSQSHMQTRQSWNFGILQEGKPISHKKGEIAQNKDDLIFWIFRCILTKTSTTLWNQIITPKLVVGVNWVEPNVKVQQDGLSHIVVWVRIYWKICMNFGEGITSNESTKEKYLQKIKLPMFFANFFPFHGTFSKIQSMNIIFTFRSFSFLI